MLSSSSSDSPAQSQPADQARSASASAADAILLARLRALAKAYMVNPALTPAWLASAARLSERTLYRRLREMTGLTPAGFVRELRLQRARQLLRAGEPATVTAVAHAVGFVNAAHFGRAYARRFGYPPGQDLSG